MKSSIAFILTNSENQEHDKTLVIVLPDMSEADLKDVLKEVYVEGNWGCADQLDWDFDTGFIHDSQYITLVAKVKSKTWKNAVSHVSNYLKENREAMSFDPDVAVALLKDLPVVQGNPLKRVDSLLRFDSE